MSAVSGWTFGSTDPGEVLSFFDGSTIGSPNNNGARYLNDPAFNGKLNAAERLSGAKRYRVFSRLAFDLERDDAPVAAIATGTSLDFFSARMGCQLYQPVYGIDIAALCVRR